MGSRPSSDLSGDGLAIAATAATAADRSTVSAEEREQRLEDLVIALAEANAQLQRALDSRVVVEQAKGVLAERFGLEMPEAFELLRRSARNNRMRLHELATLVVESEQTPPQIGALRPTLVRSRS
ncbi:MAG TPA: ANTAR domain-containing protein [Gaiellaceae bacterium]|nr:ANTAR domain-containing protein [Gaiellaceae bacterium]